ncbi:DUF1566 domain-containing protein [Pseudomonas putida]|uniref:DUF1566 domain-containing protein n=1 Tax=Pseudomonas putida TaxID=303 RepID=A0A177SAD3_PSEPU|nr:DUF1566 domain-containing protein [Pseudomonas putida]OAI84907.1 hypothetical protein AYO28_03220 [Pseudomonas putida]
MNAQAQGNPLLVAPEIGQVWIGQGGIYLGLRQYPEGLCHLIAAAEDLSGRYAYGDYGKKVEAVSRTDGRANTEILLAREGKHPAAIAAAKLECEGHQDFYLPSIGELHHAWQFAPESFATNWWYWSSSQSSANHAYILDFAGGWLYGYGKYNERLVRPVRRFLQ